MKEVETERTIEIETEIEIQREKHCLGDRDIANASKYLDEIYRPHTGNENNKLPLLLVLHKKVRSSCLYSYFSNLETWLQRVANIAKSCKHRCHVAPGFTRLT